MRFQVERLLLQNGYFKISKENLKLQLASHPDYPSIKAITDTLDYFKIENIAVTVPKDSLDKIPSCFLALMDESENGSMALVSRKNHDKYLLYFDQGVNRVFNANSFKGKWTGTIVAVEKVNNQKKKVNYFINIILLLCFLLFVISIKSISLFALLILVLNCIGIFLSYLITQEEMGIYSKITNSVCGSGSKEGGCSDVINSASGKIFGLTTLSDLSLIFFSSYAFVIAFLGYDYLFSILLFVLSVPILIFSVYNQAFVLKQWCALCIGVIGILFTQILVTTLFGVYSAFDSSYFVKAGLTFSLFFVLWKYLKPALVSQIEFRKINYEFLKFKRNQTLFKAVLSQRKIGLPNLVPIENKICFGPANPLLTIYAVTNPLCGFCADAFMAYEKIIRGHGDKVCVDFIFSVPNTQKENKATQIASQIIEIYASGRRDLAWNSIYDWYKNRDIEMWQAKYGVPSNLNPFVDSTLFSHRQWCELNEIVYTPATILEEYIYPQEYKSSDLPMLVGDLILERTSGELVV